VRVQGAALGGAGQRGVGDVRVEHVSVEQSVEGSAAAAVERGVERGRETTRDLGRPPSPGRWNRNIGRDLYKAKTLHNHSMLRGERYFKGLDGVCRLG
jgi:hypothetical protein